MNKTRISFFIFFLVAFAAAFGLPGAFAAESPQDIMAGVVVDEIASFLDGRVDVHETGEFGIAIHTIGDETGALGTEAVLLKGLLYGKLLVSSRFSCVGGEEAERAAEEILGEGPVETAPRDALKELGGRLGARHLVSGRFFRSDENTYFQMYLFDLWEGILLYTPIFDVPELEAERIEVPEPEKPDPEFVPEGGLRFFEGEGPESPVLDFGLFRDDTGALAAAFLTTTSFEVYRVMPDHRLKMIWEGEYKKVFPRRGTAASLHLSSQSGRQAAVVSMNPFTKSFRYTWDDDRFEKAGNIDGFIVDMTEGVELVSKYGKGVVSFDGVGTTLRVTGATGEAEKKALPLPVDYFDGCILEWESASFDLARVAVVDETGVIRVYGMGGVEMMKTGERYGGGLDCGARGGERYLAASTTSAEQDAILLLSREEDGLREVWRSRTVRGAIYSQKFFDINDDGRDEIAGVLEEEGGRQRLFAVAPVYIEEDVSADDAPAAEEKYVEEETVEEDKLAEEEPVEEGGEVEEVMEEEDEDEGEE